jgi:hypothetical protein
MKDIPAFPLSVAHIPGVQEGGYEMGMTLRDYFAAKAMQGLMGGDWSDHKGTNEELIGIWAWSAYEVADAMLAAREAK